PAAPDGSGSTRGGSVRVRVHRAAGVSAVPVLRASALALLVAQVLADDHHATVPADHLALVADGLDAGLDLHGRGPPRGLLWIWLLVAVDDAAAVQVVRREL